MEANDTRNAEIRHFSDLNDRELEEYLNTVLVELQRRAAQANIPKQVAELAVAYQAGGGNVTDLHNSITPVVVPPVEPELPIEEPEEPPVEPELPIEEPEEPPVEPELPIEEPEEPPVEPELPIEEPEEPPVEPELPIEEPEEP